MHDSHIVVTGGGGKDTFELDVSTLNAHSTIEITDFTSGTDKIDLRSVFSAFHCQYAVQQMSSGSCLNITSVDSPGNVVSVFTNSRMTSSDLIF